MRWYMNMKKSEFWGAMIMFALHVLLFPVLISLFMIRWPHVLSSAQLNLIYYLTSAVLTFVFLGKFLRTQFDPLVDRLWAILSPSCSAGRYTLCSHSSWGS